MANLENMAYLDQSKAIIAGGSYGAFLISWMMGHEIIKKVCNLSLLNFLHCVANWKYNV